ncbi:MAG: glycosyltransferase family 2 protein [Roseburia sp.]|nr:glycosyltransferase family 2 protein [Roseburia sp.]
MRDLSITIVSYHNEEDVKKAVASIEEHTPASISKQIYIVDNAEAPMQQCVSENAGDSENRRPANELAELEQQYKDVMYLPTGKNMGFGGGHNYVIKQLDSRYHAIVNPDIILEEDAFSKLITFMEDDSIGMCVPRLVDEEGNLLGVYRRDLTIWDMFIRMFLKGAFKKRQAYHTMQDMDYSKPFDVPFAQGSFLVIRTELFRQLKGFDERFFLYMEDADLCKRLNQISRLCYCPYATVIHKWEKGSHKSKKLFKLHVQSMISYFGKWGLK